MTENAARRPYQLRGKDKIISSPSCGLFFSMGLGKTLSTLDAIHELMWNYLSVRKVLVIAPKRVARIAWPQQIKEWYPDLKYSVIYDDKERDLAKYAEIYLLSYSTLPWLYRKMIKDPNSVPKFDMVVYDESKFLKNQGSQRWELCNAMFANVKRKVILSGKPAPNGLLDMWSQIYLLDNGERLFRSYEAFRSCKFIPAGEGIYKRYEPMQGTREWIAKQISDIIITIKDDESVKLPALIQNTVKCELDDWDQKSYDKFERDHLISIGDLDIICNNPASSLAKLRQFAQGFMYGAPKELTKGRDTMTIHVKKLEALGEIIDGSVGMNMIVAVQFIEDVIKIKEWFHNPPAIYSGTTDKQSDKYIADWNAGKIPLLIVHPASVSHGLNIQSGGNVIVWFGIPWDLDHYDQLLARLVRPGQIFNVIEHIICMTNTIDEVILKSLAKKDKTQNSLIDELVKYIEEKIS